MAKKNKYENYTREELIEELEAFKKKRYGLVWDRKNSQELIDAFVNWENVPENFTPNKFPVLKEVKNKEISTDKEKSINLLIEGDNYHSLAVLNFTHKNKIDVIYIDPPYNTGNNDFVFNDNFVDREDPWRHSKWLTFMEKRLKLAQSLLRNTGVIFVSIDDNEVAQLKLLMDEIFGEKNFIGNIIWHKKDNASFLSKKIVNLKEYVLFYSKSDNFIGTEDKLIDVERHRELITKPSKIQERIFYKKSVVIENGKFSGLLKRGKYGNPQFAMEILEDVKIIKGKPRNDIHIKGKFCWSQETIDEEVKKGGYIEIKSISGMKPIFFKNFGEDIPYRPIIDILSKVFDNRVKTTQDADRDLKDLFGDSSIFNYSKPRGLMEILIGSVTRNSKKQYFILDFFAGTGTTGHAVLNINKEDGGQRRFILCTNNRDENGIHKICTDVCYPRIEKAIKGFKAKNEKIYGLGGNLKYFKTDFVGAQPTDKNKRDLVNNSAEIICIREDIFDLVAENNLDWKIYQKGKKYLGIIFNEEAIDDFKKAANKFKGQFIIYCFSYTETLPEKEFTDLKNKHRLESIPEIILKVYREIFKK
ncbi:MAG: site-specific DNA-methyltransferase [Patescibacteria group bacterium]